MDSDASHNHDRSDSPIPEVPGGGLVSDRLARNEPTARPGEMEALSSGLREAIERSRAAPGRSGDGRRDAVRSSIREVRRRHVEGEVTLIEVATEVVAAIARDQFPQEWFSSSIERWGREIAGLLLDDPVGREHFIALWDEASRWEAE